MNYLIREGKVSDMITVLELIEELSIIKREQFLVSITIYDLIKDGFSLKPLFNLFVTEIDDKVVGFALFYKSYSTNGRSLIIEDVFVTKDYKKKGIGIALFAKILDFAKTKEINRIEWALNKRFGSLIELYKRVGAKILHNTSIFELDVKKIDSILSEKVQFDDNSPFKNIIIRYGEIKDMPSVLDLIEQLVVYKKSTFDIDVKDLIRNGFSKRPFFKTIVLEIENVVVGMLMFYHTYSTFRGKSLIIEDIFIQKKYRGYGFGKALDYKFFEYANNNNIKRIEQAIFDYDDEAINRCIEFGAEKVDEMCLVQISSEALNKFINKR